MIYSLSVLDRLLVLNLLPAENNITTLKVIRSIKDKIGFSEDELTLLEFQQKDKATVWKQNVVADKDIELGEKSVDIIIESLKELDNQKKLTDAHISIYDKFVGVK